MGADSMTQVRSGLLERDAELAAVQAIVDGAQTGRGRFVAFEGSAGIGKTTLLAEARSLAESAGLHVLGARAGELEGEFAFGVVRQLLEPTVASAPDDVRAELFAGAASLAAPLFDTAPATAPETSFGVLHGLFWLAANLTAIAPTMLLVDDMHWADEPSLRWLAFLGRRLTDLPLLVVVATRPPDESKRPALVAEVLSEPDGTLIRPGLLRLSSVVRLVEERLGVAPSPPFAAALHHASAGNPLYLAALLDAAVADGLEPTAENVGRVLETGAHGVARSVSLRIDRAGASATALANAAAVLGDGTQLTFAAALAGMDPDLAGDAATALVRAGLLRREDPLEFTHPLIRTAIYERIGAGDRFRAHRAAAELLLAGGARAEQAAGHLVLTPPRGDAFVCDTLRAAAARASAQGSQEAAAAYLRRALEEPPVPGEVARVLADLGLAERLVDSGASVEHLGRALELLTDPEARAPIVLKYSESLWLTSGPAEAVRVLDELIRELDEPSDLRERALAGLIGAARWDPDLCAVALDQLERVDPDALVGELGADSLLAIAAEQEMYTGVDRARAASLATRSLASGRLAETRDFGLFCAAAALRAAGDHDAALAAVDAGVREGRRAGDLLAVAALMHLRGGFAFGRGDLTTAESEMADARDLVDSVTPAREWPSKYGGPWRMRLAVEQGELALASDILSGIEETPVEPRYAAWVCHARGELRLAERRAEEALADFLACGRALDAFAISNPAYFPWRSRAALALLQLGRIAEARELAEDELERSHRWGAPQTVGISLHALALVRGDRPGLRLLHEAVEVLEGSSARLEHARALADLGAALRRTNRRADARVHLRNAVDLARRCGSAPLVDRANDELAATGAHRRTVLVTGVESLTASELRVAQLAADDLSNKDIAQALFVTIKTVEVHLSSVYRKLEISSRRQLAEALVA